MSYWSLSQYLKHKVKNAVSFISDFELALVSEARRKGYDGVVCGHIHKPQIKTIDGILYCNDGDWVESLSALVETHSGELRLVHWPYLNGDASDFLPLSLDESVDINSLNVAHKLQDKKDIALEK